MGVTVPSIEMFVSVFLLHWGRASCYVDALSGETHDQYKLMVNGREKALHTPNLLPAVQSMHKFCSSGSEWVKLVISFS